jgi:hypothetical protein
MTPRELRAALHEAFSDRYVGVSLAFDDCYRDRCCVIASVYLRDIWVSEHFFRAEAADQDVACAMIAQAVREGRSGRHVYLDDRDLPERHQQQQASP